jgi:cytochrome P450
MARNMTASTASPAVPAFAADPFADEFLHDPYDRHERMREAGPVVYLARYATYATARFEQVHSVLNDPGTFCSAAGVGLSDFTREKPWRPPSLLLEADPPDHTRARRAITRVLSPRVVRTFTRTFADEADRLVGELAEKGTFDAVTELAEAFPLKVFPDAVGLPAEGRENLLPYGNMVFNGFGPRNQLFDEAMARGAAVREWIMEHCRAEALGDGGLGALIYAAATEEGYGAEHTALLVRSFLSAGVDTTVHGIGNAILCLATHPQQWRALRADPAMARAAFEEVIRFESPVQTFFRTTTREAELGGAVLPAGAKVLTFLGAANRDPRRWDRPERFDITRRAVGHVGFGSGIHACVGQMLARLEGQVVLAALARRFERIELAGPPVRRLNNTLRGLSSLPITVH